MSTTNGLTKSVWAEFALHSGEEVFSITHAIYNPSYVEWLESELWAARQKIKEAEQTPTNKQSTPCCPKCGKSDRITWLWSCTRCEVDEA